MLCPSCNSKLKILETISSTKKNYRHFKCPECSCKFYSKEELVDSDDPEVLAQFREWTKERGKKHRAKQRGEEYEVQFADGRQAPPKQKKKLNSLF